MNKLAIIHTSDWHYTNDTIENINNKLNQLKNILDNDIKADINIHIVTGDLINKGSVDELLEVNKIISKDLILPVIGNHDVLFCGTEIFNSFNPLSNSLFLSIIEKQLEKIIKQYIDKDNTIYRNSWSYETEIDGLKCLVVNKKTNSWVFGEKYNEYPIVMVWAFNGTKYSYSIFSNNPDIDCSKIAEKYGGGGHKGAAGFSSDELLFKKV